MGAVVLGVGIVGWAVMWSAVGLWVWGAFDRETSS
jgi:hypothetical protein